MTMQLSDLMQLAVDLGQALSQRHWLGATAESCTGGWVAEAITSVAGSSQWFDRGFVTYSNQAKQEMLGVQTTTLAEMGAVSEQTAREMAQGAIRNSRADIAVAVTGIAGPDGGSQAKPVGTVWFAWAGKTLATQACCCHLQGDRYSIRLQATQYALEGLLARSQILKS